MERIKTYLKKVEPYHIVSVLAIGGIIFAAANFSGPPLFNNLDNFVLFAQEEIKLEQGTQVSSGDLGSNKEIDIEKDTIINGNLFADKITLDKNTIVNGNVSFNKLKIKEETQILGTQTKPVQLPIANLPEIPDFQIGTQDFKFEGQNNALASSNYRDITLEKNSKLILSGGTYNLRKLELKENSTLIFSAPTTLNIQFKLKGQNRVSILPGQNLKPQDLAINYIGICPKQDKEVKEDDDEEINALHDDKEKKDYKEQKIGRPIVFGKESFLNFKFLAPKASVKIGETSTVRGQILARKIKIEKGLILSRQEFFVKESDPAKVVEDAGIKFIVNEIIVVFNNGVTIADVQQVASLVNGKITGFVSNPPTYKIELVTNSIEEIKFAIQTIKNSNNPLVVEVVQNLTSQ